MLTEPRKVAIHCYGCPATVPVDPDDIGGGIQAAGWSADHGRTYCPTCAAARGLEPPWPFNTVSNGSTPQGEEPTKARTPLVSPTLFQPTPAELDPPAGPALRDQQTAAALDRLRRKGWIWTGAAVALLVLFVALVNISQSHSKQLLETGTRTTGVIVSVFDPPRGEGYFRVQYQAAGIVRQGRVNLTSSSELYHPGEYVDVIYDPNNPARIRTPEEPNEPQGMTMVTIVALIGGMVLLTVGIQALRRAKRWRREFAGARWTPYKATYIPAPTRRSSAGLKLTPLDRPEANPQVVKIQPTIGSRPSNLAGHGVVWVAGDPKSKVAIATPGGAELHAGAPATGYFAKHLTKSVTKPRSPRREVLGRFYLLAIALVDLVIAAVAADHGDTLIAVTVFAKGIALLVAYARADRPAAD